MLNELIKKITSNKKNLYLTIGGFALGLILIIVLILALASNKKPAPTTPTNVTLQFWGKSLEEESMQPVIASFNQKYPNIKINYIKESPTEYKARLQNRFEQKNAQALPDIVEIEESWIPQFSTFLRPLDSKNFGPKYSNQVLQNNKVGNSTFGMPFNFDSLVLVYNVNHLQEINYEEAKLTTLDWSSLSTVAKQLTKINITKPTPTTTQKEFVRGGLAIGSPTNVTNADKILELLALQNGSSYYDAKNKKYLLDGQFSEILDFYTKFYANELWSNSLENDLVAFSKGKASMVIVRKDDIKRIVELNPTLTFKVIAPPSISAVQNISLSTSLAVPLVSSKSQYAQLFLDYLSETENVNQLYQSENIVKFIPAQFEAINQITLDSPYHVFAAINPTVKTFSTQNFELFNTRLATYLIEVFNNVKISNTGAVTVENSAKRLETLLNQAEK